MWCGVVFGFMKIQKWEERGGEKRKGGKKLVEVLRSVLFNSLCIRLRRDETFVGVYFGFCFDIVVYGMKEIILLLFFFFPAHFLFLFFSSSPSIPPSSPSLPINL